MQPSSTQVATRGVLADWSVSAIAAGFLAVLISYAGPLVIFFQAAQAAHVPDAMVASWVWAISIGAAVSGIYASWRWRAPVVTAWSAPGTALLVSLFPALSLNEAVGAYITAAVVILLIGVSGSFDRLMRLIPKGIANGVFYLIGGTFAGAIVMLFAALPKPFVAILAGLALIGAIASNVMGAIEDGEHREASIITFLATASGLTLFGLGSAFWGIVIGSATALSLKPARR